MEDRCVCCGEIIPEGRMVCMQCEAGYKTNTTNAGEMEIKHNENVLINHVETCGRYFLRKHRRKVKIKATK